MKVEVASDALAPILHLMAAVVGRRRSDVTVPNHVLFTPAEGGVIVTASSEEVEIRRFLPCTVSGASAHTLPPRKLLDIARNLPTGSPVRISFEPKWATVHAHRGRYQLGSFDGERYPRMPDSKQAQSVKLPQRAAKWLLERVRFCVASDNDSRTFLRGVLLTFSDGQLRSVGTDGHRLGLAECAGDAPGGEVRSVIIPRRAVQDLSRLLESDDEPVRMAFTDRYCRVYIGGTVLTANLLGGSYPEYTAVIPRADKPSVTVERAGLLAALNRVSVVASGQARGVRMAVSERQIALSSSGGDDHGDEVVDAAYDGEAVEVGLNVAYFSEAVGGLDDATIRLYPGDGSGAVLMTGASATAQRYVVMPMRL